MIATVAALASLVEATMSALAIVVPEAKARHRHHHHHHHHQGSAKRTQKTIKTLRRHLDDPQAGKEIYEINICRISNLRAISKRREASHSLALCRQTEYVSILSTLTLR